MPDSFEPFATFHAHVHAADSADEAIQRIEALTDAVPIWSKRQCEAWIKPVLAWPCEGGDLDPEAWSAAEQGEDDYSSTPSDVFASALRLVESVMARCRTVRVAIPRSELDGLVVDLACVDSTQIVVPPRELVGLYDRWITDQTAPCLGLYFHQSEAAATAAECVEIAERMRVLDQYGNASAWIGRALPHALRLQPAFVPDWLAHLEDGWRGLEPDPFEYALVEHYRRWLRALPPADSASDDPPPSDVLAYIRSRGLDVTRVRPAARAVAKGGSWRLSPEHVKELVERDLAVLVPRLPRHVERVVCDDVRDVLSTYERLQLTGTVSPLTGCLLLTSALELHLRRYLVRGLERRHAISIGELTLRALLKLVEGERVGEIPVRALASPKVVLEFLRRAASTRNDAHHHTHRLNRARHIDLHRALFDDDDRAPRVLSAIAKMIEGD